MPVTKPDRNMNKTKLNPMLPIDEIKTQEKLPPNSSTFSCFKHPVDEKHALNYARFTHFCFCVPVLFLIIDVVFVFRSWSRVFSLHIFWICFLASITFIVLCVIVCIFQFSTRGKPALTKKVNLGLWFLSILICLVLAI
jgi:NADH:ubiquinone oxidoreductase subunit 3 (subunit A)